MQGGPILFAWQLILATLCLGAATGDRPNILFIAIDDLNDWIGPLGGHPQAITPNLDRLAERGVTFLNAHCTIPICSPSRTSFMTGLYPENTGVFTNGNSLFDVDPAILTLPQHLAAQGYATLGAGKLFHGSDGAYTTYFQSYGPSVGNQGGPFTREELNTLNQNPTHKVDRGPGKLQATLPLNGMPDDRRDGSPRNNSFDWGTVNVPASDMPDGQIAQWAVEHISADHQQPFFIGAGFYRPHQPLFAPAEYFRPFDPEQMILPEVLIGDLEALPPYAECLARYPLTAGIHKTVLEYGQWEEAVAAYLACVLFVDDQLGSIIDALDKSPVAGNTWIILLSDHGYHLGEKEHWGKFTPWAESTRVPLMVIPPTGMASGEWARGRKVDEPISLLDIYPTLMEVCGIEAPAHQLDGHSFASLLRNEPQQTGTERFAVSSVGRGTHSIIKGKFRYVRYFDGSEELYDQKADPNEFHNLAHEPRFSDLKLGLARLLPDDPEVAHFIRHDWKKIILFKDPDKNPIVYGITPGTASGGGIGETRNLAADFPEMLQEIRSYLARHPSPPKRLTIEKDDLYRTPTD